VNRVAWNLRYDGPKKLTFLPPPPAEREEEEFFFDPNTGPTVLPGTYKVAVTVNGKTETQNVQVESDPRFDFDKAALNAQLKLGLELRDEVSALNEALNRLNSLHKQITSLQEIINGEEGQEGQVNVAYKPVLEQAKALDKKLTAMENPLYNTEVQPYGQDDIHYLQRFHDQMQGLMRSVMNAYGEAPSPVQLEEAASLRKELEKHLDEFNAFLNTDVAAFNKTASQHGSSTLFAGTPVQIKSEGAASSGAGNEEEENQ
jgi:DNA-binding protein YbaB